MKAGEKLGKYLIESVIGRGAMGVVYKAHDPNMERDVAIKVLRADIVDTHEEEALGKRFAAEAKAYGRLLHPNIVTCYGCDDFDGKMGIVMEYVDGHSLKQMFDTKVHFPVTAVKQMISQLLAALAYSHEHGVVHRDIKPANLLLTRDGRLKVTDFGIARIDTTNVTQTGYVLGSPSYMSPEQFAGTNSDERTDLFSAGVLLYQLLTGRKPFCGTDLGEALHQIMNVTPPTPSSVNNALSAEIDAVVMKALIKAPQDRYSTANEFLNAVEKVLKIPDPTPASLSELTQTVTVKSNQHINKGDGKSNSRVRGASVVGGVATASLAGIVFWGSFMNENAQTPVTPDPLAAIDEKSSPMQNERIDVAAEPEIASVTPVGFSTSTTQQGDGASTDAALVVSESAVREALLSFACHAIDVSINQGQVRLAGDISAPASVDAVRAAVTNVPGVVAVSGDLRVVPRAYCDVMAVVRPFVEGGETQVSQDRTPMAFKEGDPLVLDVVSPPFEAYMYVDYFTRDGNVVHLFPSGDDNNQLIANMRKRIGEPGDTRRHWEVSPPFGQEIITIIGAKTPLFESPRIESENAAVYLSDLDNRMATMDEDVTANYTVIVTEPR